MWKSIVNDSARIFHLSIRMSMCDGLSIHSGSCRCITSVESAYTYV
ncbi:Uncharacterized protein BM_BM13433 [Brugia malayi]|uniref:Bm13433 n=1 Tax=Brugia malayi TaxID=6279 RepID=A0A0J9XTA1_BRUMA|nr:Uncharacterized protein BM_BM13433 [Brugia malayi]CDP94626.1 Bm13433 [Brugia malayi]VIO86810.1 Uncharacterized protein BM_BM13433 [Brugia malayi]